MTICENRTCGGIGNCCETTGYRVVRHEELLPADAARIAELYRLLYIDKYSEHNPRFTSELMEEFRSRRLLQLWGLRRSGRQLGWRGRRVRAQWRDDRAAGRLRHGTPAAAGTLSHIDVFAARGGGRAACCST